MINALPFTVKLLVKSRLVVTYLDRYMGFVWTLKLLDKTSLQRSS
jgi:hypothetical protein